MGDRSTTIFVAEYDGKLFYSAGVYTHWCGSVTLDFIKETFANEYYRDADPDYAAARFCGFCHEQTKHSMPTGLGLVNVDNEKVRTFTHKQWVDWGPGDAGVFIVNTDTWQVTIHDYDGEKTIDLSSPLKKLVKRVNGTG